ncbi:unnamed protein product [Chironomus riparius]|uniref:Ionotropic glutamate receptor C-terminal domain-containing protein n=1 Tax=Chironomus riparius TaxID=315576 RepID=A0A9N9S7W1_9DIPT|nr:unnamed protein product [Chironomus riparius]
MIANIFNYTTSYFKVTFNNAEDSDVHFDVCSVRTFFFSGTHMSASFVENREIIITTPGELYTSYEKLWLPFDDATWKFLISTFFIAFQAILIIYRLPKLTQTRFFGEDIKTPSLNIVSTFFGIPQLKLPTSHIPRLILVFFIFFCLIFRTCYQSKLFEFLTSEPRRSPPQTIKELKDKDFKIYGVNAINELDDINEDVQKYWPQTITVDHIQYSELFLTQSKNASAKIALIAQELGLTMISVGGHNIKWHKLPNYSIYVSQSGFGFAPNNFFYRIIDETVERLVSGGIMNRMVDMCLPLMRSQLMPKTAFVLKVENLEFGFVIWMGCCGLCVACFLSESIIWNVWKFMRYYRTQKEPIKIKFEKIYPDVVSDEIRFQNVIKNCNTFRMKRPKLVENEVSIKDLDLFKDEFSISVETIEDMDVGDTLLNNKIEVRSELQFKDIEESLWGEVSALFFVYSCSDFASLHSAFQLRNWAPKVLKYLIHIENCGLEELQINLVYLINSKRLTYAESSLQVFTSLLIHDDHFIYLTSLEWFTEVACNEAQLVVLNSFDKRTRKWTKELKNYEKFMNFHGCNLRMGIVDLVKNRCFGEPEMSNNTMNAKGIKPDLFETISKKANYTTSYALIMKGETADFDVFFDVYHQMIFSKTDFHMTTSFIESKEIIVTTPGELYTSYEKLWLPFDDTTWTLLIITFLISTFVILIIHRLSKFMQERIFGENVKTPMLNLISTFFGISQYRLPFSHIPRFVLILYVFYCLIFRTCYQSKLFEFMTSEPRRDPPRTMKDLWEKNFVIYWDEDIRSVNDITDDEKKYWPQIVTVNNDQYNDFYSTQSQNASTRIGLIVQELAVKMFDHFKYNIKWHKLPNYSLYVGQSGFIFRANNFFFRIVDETIQRLTSGGIMNHLIKKCFPAKTGEVEVKEATVLKIKDLNFGFNIWLGCCAVCASCFVIELFVWIISQIIKCFEAKRKKKMLKFAKIFPEVINVDRLEPKCQQKQDLFRIQKLN